MRLANSQTANRDRELTNSRGVDLVGLDKNFIVDD